MDRRGAESEVEAVTDGLEQAIVPLCTAAGLDLVDVELRQRTLLVTVEGEGGLDLDRIAEVARAISNLLDEHEELAPQSPFELEVSSPGVERRLRRPQHFQRVIGSGIALRTMPGTEGERRFEAVLKAADDESVLLTLADGTERRLAYSEIERAHTIFDWRAALGSAATASDDSDIDGSAPTELGSVGAGPATRTRSGRTSRPTRERESR